MRVHVSHRTLGMGTVEDGHLTERLLEAPDLLETIAPGVVDAGVVACADCVELGFHCTLPLRSRRDRGSSL